MKQEEIALWTGVKGNGSMHDGDGTIGHELTTGVHHFNGALHMFGFPHWTKGKNCHTLNKIANNFVPDGFSKKPAFRNMAPKNAIWQH